MEQRFGLFGKPTRADSSLLKRKSWEKFSDLCERQCHQCLEDKEKRGIRISLYQKPNVVDAVRNKRLQWTGHTWRNQNPLLRTVLETGKKTHWKTKDEVKKCSEEWCGRVRRRNRLEGASNWPGWMDGWTYDGMVLKAANTEKMTFACLPIVQK